MKLSEDRNRVLSFVSSEEIRPITVGRFVDDPIKHLTKPIRIQRAGVASNSVVNCLM